MLKHHEAWHVKDAFEFIPSKFNWSLNQSEFDPSETPSVFI
jgi:hypothetical protein